MGIQSDINKLKTRVTKLNEIVLSLYNDFGVTCQFALIDGKIQEDACNIGDGFIICTPQFVLLKVTRHLDYTPET